MSDENQNEESEGITEIPRMDDDEIREFVRDLEGGHVFTSDHVKREEDIPRVFMPLLMGAAAQFEDVIDDVGVLYEYTDKAGPRAVNGMPMFMSFSLMHKDDWKIVLDTYNEEKFRRDTMPVVRNTDED